MKDTLTEEFSKEAEKHKTKTAEEFQKWREEYMKHQENEIKAKKKQLQKEFHEIIDKARDILREGVVEENTSIASTLPSVFTSYF